MSFTPQSLRAVRGFAINNLLFAKINGDVKGEQDLVWAITSHLLREETPLRLLYGALVPVSPYIISFTIHKLSSFQKWPTSWTLAVFSPCSRFKKVDHSCVSDLVATNTRYRHVASWIPFSVYKHNLPRTYQSSLSKCARKIASASSSPRHHEHFH